MTEIASKSAFEIVSGLLSEDTSNERREAMFHELVSRPITEELLTEGALALREHMIPVHLHANEAIDTCGTGGSGKKTINTSTLTAFIVSAAGGKVAKHGNRSASGNCGCFDLLEKLGVRIDLTPAQEQKVFDKLGIVFLFAPAHHPALRFVAPLRKQYGKKTVFNLIGPLCNPAGVTAQLIGNGSEEQANLLASAIQKLGTDRTLIVTGHDGLDEVTLTTKTTVRNVTEEEVSISEFNPLDFGIALVHDESIEGGDHETNVKIFLDIAQGNGTEAMKNLAIVNAAHALLLTPLASTIDEAIHIARSTLGSGAVFDLFARYKEFITTLQ